MRRIVAFMLALGITAAAAVGTHRLQTTPELETIMYGHVHLDQEAHRQISLDLKELRKEGYQHLAIEWSSQAYSEISDYLEGRKTIDQVRPKTKRNIEGQPEVINLIKGAKKLGYTIIPIDIETKESGEYRDPDMLQKLKEESPNMKRTVIFVGSWHIREEDSVYPMNGKVETPLGKLLDQETEGNNYRILVYSTCIADWKKELVNKYTPNPDERRIIECVE